MSEKVCTDAHVHTHTRIVYILLNVIKMQKNHLQQSKLYVIYEVAEEIRKIHVCKMTKTNKIKHMSIQGVILLSGRQELHRNYRSSGKKKSLFIDL